MIAREPAVEERLSQAELDACFDYTHHLKQIARAYERLQVDRDCEQITGWPVYEPVFADDPDGPQETELES